MDAHPPGPYLRKWRPYAKPKLGQPLAIKKNTVL
jgi:hypothetical protein